MMIVDTTYLLPLARIEIETDLLRAVAERKIPRSRLSFDQIQINSISIFELQAKAAKLKVDPDYVLAAIEEISKSFTMEPYYSPNVVKRAFELKTTILSDYIDCIILASAVELKTSLITEDSRIRRVRRRILDKYGTEILTFREILKT
jgi:predicted nucleic acid-binding protein